MAIEYNFTLDMDRSKRDNNIAYARTGDVDSITINADLVLNGTAYTPTGTNAFFECITPNGHSIRVAAEKTGSTVSVDVPSAAFQAAGVINVAYFRFESGEADNPTYVESTEPFAIVVREGIGDNIDAGDYIEEWRQLADQLEAVVAEVEQKAEQAEAAINEQKTEVDQLKAQAQTAIAGDVTEVEAAAQSAITAINQEKADVAEAAEDVSAAGEQAISQFNTNSQQAINQFNTKADAKLDEVDGMITEAQGDVDAAITQLENETQNAIDAAHDALDGTTATNLQNAINRTLKLDVADMTVIPDNASLSSFTNVGSYCCKTAATAATIGDCPIDDSPFNMYVFSSSTSGQVMQLVIPIDLNGKPTAEWHVRFGTSSAMDKWSVIGGGADVAAGLGIDVTGDAQKTVSLDTDVFYQHHEAVAIIQGSTEVTGGGRIKELVVYGSTRQNLWVNPSGKQDGITVTANEDGSMTVSGTATSYTVIYVGSYALRPGSTYHMNVDSKVSDSGALLGIEVYDSKNSWIQTLAQVGKGANLDATFTVPSNAVRASLYFLANENVSVSGTYRVMLNEGSEPEPWCPPGLNGVDELSIVTAGKNLWASKAFTDGGIAAVVNDDGSVTLNGTSTTSEFGNKTAVTGLLSPGKYTLSVDRKEDENASFFVRAVVYGTEMTLGSVKYLSETFTIPVGTSSVSCGVQVIQDDEVHGTFRVQLERGSTATAYEPPNITTTPIDLDGHALNSLPDGTRDELRIDGTGAVTLVQRVGVAIAPTDASVWTFVEGRGQFNVPGNSTSSQEDMTPRSMCDKLPVRKTASDPAYAFVSTSYGYAKHPSITGTSTAASIAGGATYLYPLATPKEIDLPGISMPSLASPSYVIFASSNLPAEIEAEVVKVDYLPPSDVYTKAEVDKKIEDAGGMPDVVPVSQGGTGVTTAAAERNRLGLGNTTGALPIANGGTGNATAKASQNALLGIMEDAGTVPEDNSNIVFRYASPSAAKGAVFSRKASSVWSYIASKIRSTFGFSSSNVLPISHGGTGGTSAKAAQNSLLNDMNVSSDALTDSSMLVGYNASPSASNGAVHKRRMATIWEYVVDKIRSTFGFSSSNVLPVANGGTGATEPGVTMLSNLGITFGTADPPSTGTPGSIYIQYFE